MEARIDVITLAVDDFERALAFYRALGFESKGVVATEYVGDDTHPAGAIAMVHVNGGQILSLYPRSDLAKDAGIPTGPAQSGEFSLGHIVGTRAEVDALLAKAKAAGAPVTEVHDRPWGIYSGYFRDPDGHLCSCSSICRHSPRCSAGNSVQSVVSTRRRRSPGAGVSSVRKAT